MVLFVDKTMSGEYSLEYDPCAYDALTNVPGAGLTQAEQIGMSSKTARFQNTNGTTCGAPLGGTPESMNQFTRMELISNLEKAPPIKFLDLEKLRVSSTISYATLAMLSHVDYLRISDTIVMTNVTIQFDNRDLSFQLKDGVEKAVVNLLGHVYTMTERPVNTFEKPLDISFPEGMLQRSSQQKSVYQESLPLAPGRYKLVLVAKDTVSGNANVMTTVLDVPHFASDKLATSNLILADKIEPLPTKKTNGEMFAIGDWKVRPRIDAQFSRDEKLGVYMQVYNLTKAGRIAYQVTRTGTEETLVELSEDLASAPQATIVKLIRLDSLGTGDFTVKLSIQDGDRTVQQQARFTIR